MVKKRNKDETGKIIAVGVNYNRFLVYNLTTEDFFTVFWLLMTDARIDYKWHK